MKAPIKGFEGFYEIDTNGVVYSLPREIKRRNKYGEIHTYMIEGKIITPKKRGMYLSVILYRYGVKSQVNIHRVVAETFIENPKKLLQVNHLDENKHNNFVDNLEWCTPQDNQLHSNGKHVSLMSPSGEVVTRFGFKKFCREFELNECSVWRILNGKQKQTKGWRLP